MDTADTTQAGRRERQRAQAMRDIHRAAVELVSASGLAETTVEAIAERAGVSRRTFFNYYATKEDAVLGMAPPAIPEAALTRYAGATEDAFTRTVHLIMSILRSSVGPDEMHLARLQLVRENLDLRERLREHVIAVEHLVQTTLDGSLGTTVGRSPEQLRALIMLAGTVLRFAVADDPNLLATLSDDEMDAAVERAVEVFRQAIGAVS